MATITVKLRTLVAFATGLAVALVAVIVFQAWRADAAPGDVDSTFVPIAPCRLVDTRPAPDRVGPFGAFGPAQTATVTAHGTNGNCTIPADAVGLSLNVTAVGATANTFLTFWGDGARPVAANLNPRAGGPVAANAVNTPLSGSGTFQVFNKAGIVDIVVDVNGYYSRDSLQAIVGDIAALRAAQPFAVTTGAADLVALTTDPTAYLTLTVDAPVAGHVTLVSTAAVVQSQDGNDVYCVIAEADDLPAAVSSLSVVGVQYFERASFSGDAGSISGTRTFPIDAGESVEFVLACNGLPSGGLLVGRNMTAIFTPAV